MSEELFWRFERLGGRKQIVTRMVPIVSGVMKTSSGTVLYHADGIVKDPEVWNGTPILIGQPPTTDWRTAPDALEVCKKQLIGAFYRSKAVVDTSGKPNKPLAALSGEAWFDIDEVKKKDVYLWNALMGRMPVEIYSILHADLEPAQDDENIYQFVSYRYPPSSIMVVTPLYDTVGNCGAASLSQSASRSRKLAA